MLSNNEIKKIKSLQQKKFRDEYGLFIAEGEKMVQEAADSPFYVENVYRRDEISETVMKKISALANPSPALAVIRKPSDIVLELSDLHNVIKNKGLYLALDSMRDPGNLGTVLRIADWFGIDAIFASMDTVDLFNPKVVQATMGAVFRVRFHYADLVSVSEIIKKKGGNVYGTFLDGGNIYSKELNAGEDSPSLIVIGNESEGISPEIASRVSDRLYIPPYPQDSPGSESLNAAIATAITIAEFRRRTK